MFFFSACAVPMQPINPANKNNFDAIVTFQIVISQQYFALENQLGSAARKKAHSF